METNNTPGPEQQLPGIFGYILHNKLIAFMIALLAVFAGFWYAPFDWNFAGMERNPVAVDAIPDIGENQQIVFTRWPGRSPQDVEDQVSYPLTVNLLGIPGVKSVRSYSMLGFSTVYIIFSEEVDFYWSRTRILEKLSSLAPNSLPQGVSPMLGPDATALGQVFWYTLEGRDPDGNPTGGWDLAELRTIQDLTVRYALMSASGVAEVASIGGFVEEYQVDVDPAALLAYGVRLTDVYKAVKDSNLDIGARSIEINNTEYLIRGRGFVQDTSDIEKAVVKVVDNVPLLVADVARVGIGPATRRGILDKNGTEAVGGVAIVRYGSNPLEGIKNIKEKIREIAASLPKKRLADGRESQVTIVPFYDRTDLIYETLGTLEGALSHEILITIIVIILMVMHLRSSLIIAGVMPIAIMLCFILMKSFGVDANIVALSGIAIAIGTMVDMGIVLCENILSKLEKHGTANRTQAIYEATAEVSGAVITAVSTTVVSFLPVFAMQAAEGKLFKPLAYTKTFALISALVVALFLIPPLAQVLFTGRPQKKRTLQITAALGVLAGIIGIARGLPALGAAALVCGIYYLVEDWLPSWLRRLSRQVFNISLALYGVWILANQWMPLGIEQSLAHNFFFVATLVCGLLGLFRLFLYFYVDMLSFFLRHQLPFFTVVLTVVTIGLTVWLGAKQVFFFLPHSLTTNRYVSAYMHAFPGLGKEFMPNLDEGSFLFMPTTMPHASIGEVYDVLSKQDQAISMIPEIKGAVGKLGRAETPLDPAPVSMIETIINYKPEYLLDKSGRRALFAYSDQDNDIMRYPSGEAVINPADGLMIQITGRYQWDKATGELIKDPEGRPFRLWRPQIKSTDDIWQQIVAAAKIPGTTSAPRLQPINARIVMLQSGMRAPMGIKIRGPNLAAIEAFGRSLEAVMRKVPQVEPSSVVADQIVGKPYLEIEIDREAISRFGLSVRAVQNTIATAVGGKVVTQTVFGRERYNVVVRYQRELRDSIEAISEIYIATPNGTQIPLKQLAHIEYVRGPQVIKSEDTFLIGYLLFDKKPGYAETEVVEACRDFIEQQIESGALEQPAGISYVFAGTYENQVRSEARLRLVLPLALFLIFMILYQQFKSAATTMLVFSGIIVAASGGFILLWFYNQTWFLDFDFWSLNLRELFRIRPQNLSVAVWVGFIALFGIASDDGVVMGTYLEQTFASRAPSNRTEIRAAVIEAGSRRIRPCLMTTATTTLALLPVLTSSGRGADIMVPMAIPSFGGMLIALLTLFVVPVGYSMIKEFGLHFKPSSETIDTTTQTP